MTPRENPVITLTTDFGTGDPYVGIMKGVILGINPRAVVVDLCNDVQPQNILQAAFLIGTSHRFFPQGSIHLVVVDPGVGTSRRALLLLTPSASFIAPDNGVLSYVVREGFGEEVPSLSGGRVALPAGYRAFSLTNPRYWLHPVSATFHGRDIFAPAAAHLSLGTPPEKLGEEVKDLTWLPIPEPRREGDALEGQVLHIDRFGNLITSIPARLLSGEVEVEIKGRRIVGLSPSYAQGGDLLAILGSHGNLEVAAREDSAARLLGARIGDRLRVTIRPIRP
jgi:hypothetical protein